LLSVIALGAVVTLMGAAGIFAVFTDRATTGTNTVSSGERPRAADLKIAVANQTLSDCQNFTDDLATGLVSMSNAQPGSGASKYVCLRNAGASSLIVSLSALDLTNSEDGCTGDEQAAGDQTCGTGEGELGNELYVYANQIPCEGGVGSPTVSNWLSSLAGGQTLALGTLSPNEQGCYYIETAYPGNTPDGDAQKAQSDTATWRFAFDATTS
jgi:hypothetical protein